MCTLRLEDKVREGFLVDVVFKINLERLDKNLAGRNARPNTGDT